MNLTTQQLVALRLAIDSGGRVRFARAFFSGRALGSKTVAKTSADCLQKRGLGLAILDQRDAGFFEINDSGRLAYQSAKRT